MRISHLLIAFCTIFIAAPAFAQGKAAQQLIGACSRCHGEDGNASGQYPNLAGQQAEYTAKQLMDFKSGARKNSQMSPFVGVLSEEDTRTLGKYYAEEFLKRQRAPDKDLAEQGKKIAADLQCASCHQKNYRGTALIPRLSRQNRVYLVNQMKAFRDGKRTNDNGLKTTFMNNLTDEQIKALSHYFTGM
ncbi:MAG: cytochrome c4 [Betaproteobacteria bacterium]|nr:MAG: cytochrome c4 [Betaproteobacteria bacterium]